MKTLRALLLALFGVGCLSFAQGDKEGDARPRAKNGKQDRYAPGGARPKGERGSDSRRAGPRDPRAHATRFLATYDRNQDKAVSFEEFKAAEKMGHLQEEGKRRIFDHLDKNKDGEITREELPRGGPPGRPAPGDQDGDGKISLEEFRQNPRMENIPAERLNAMFKRMDLDGDGFLTRQDFRPPRQEPFPDRKALERLDRDGDGAVSLEEWKKRLRFQNMPGKEIEKLFHRADRNNDGKLDSEDWPEGEARKPAGKRPGGTRRGPGPGPARER